MKAQYQMIYCLTCEDYRVHLKCYYPDGWECQTCEGFSQETSRESELIKPKKQ